MPELPEVETLVRRLQSIAGTTIVGAEILDDRLAISADASSMRSMNRTMGAVVMPSRL